MINGIQEPAQLKIEIPANRLERLQILILYLWLKIWARYDMLCFEGISLMLNIFRGKRDAPQYTLAPPAGGQLEHLTAHQEVSGGI